jgi:hypothetical protein
MKREWTGLIIGAWILVSPWILGFAGVDFLKWSNTIVGLALILVNGWTIFVAEKKPH